MARRVGRLPASLRAMPWLFGLHAVLASAQECQPMGGPPMFASAGFFTGQNGDGALQGNAFAVLAQAQPVCGEAGAPASCDKTDKTRRTWTATMVTAAHVVADVCRGAPGPWQALGRPDWTPSRLTLFSNYRLEETADVVEAKITADWCTKNIRALNNLPGVAEGEQTHATAATAAARADEKGDIYIFRQDFELPRRAVMIPYSLQMVPRDRGKVPVVVWGFNVDKVRGFRQIGLTGSSGARKLYWGSVDDAKFDASARSNGEYDLDADVIFGQSGSPVGQFIGNRFSVIGVLTQTRRLGCADAIRLVDGHGGSGGAGNAASAPMNAQQMLVRCSDPEVQARIRQSEHAASFVPLAREPRWYQQYYQGQPDPREDAVALLFSERNKGRPGDDPESYNEAMKDILGGLTPLQQIMMAQRIEHSANGDLLTLVCPHWEPGS